MRSYRTLPYAEPARRVGETGRYCVRTVIGVSVGLVLRAVEVAGPHRWRWLLVDESSGAPLADHQVKLDPGSAEVEAFAELYRHLRWQAEPDRRVASETELLGRRGAWIGSVALGERIGRAMVSAAPVTVRMQVPAGAEFLAFRPWELAHVDGVSLAARGDVALVYDLPGTNGSAKAPVGDVVGGGGAGAGGGAGVRGGRDAPPGARRLRGRVRRRALRPGISPRPHPGSGRRGGRVGASSALSVTTPALFGASAAGLVLTPPKGKPDLDPADRVMAGFLPEPPRFVGRAEPMAAASAALAPASGRTAVVFHGMAGGGKTACALELAYRHQRAFEALAFWSAPTDSEQFGDALLRLAVAWEAQLGATGSRGSTRSPPWLIWTGSCPGCARCCTTRLNPSGGPVRRIRPWAAECSPWSRATPNCWNSPTPPQRPGPTSLPTRGGRGRCGRGGAVGVPARGHYHVGCRAVPADPHRVDHRGSRDATRPVPAAAASPMPDRGDRPLLGHPRGDLG